MTTGVDGRRKGEGSPSVDARQERIAELERRLEDAWARLPRHSIPAIMLLEIEELEEELARLRAPRGPAAQ